MATSYEGAIRTGAMAAARLHQQLGLKEHIGSHGGGVDVFETIQRIDLPLLLRPLDGLLGAYINDPSPGILVTTRRPMRYSTLYRCARAWALSVGPPTQS